MADNHSPTPKAIAAAAAALKAWLKVDEARSVWLRAVAAAEAADAEADAIEAAEAGADAAAVNRSIDLLSQYTIPGADGAA
jgi:hypothetical protein